MPNFAHLISLAYMRILSRPPDPGGLDQYNELMNAGMTEAMMREALLRSAEYSERNPDEVATASPVGRGAGKKHRRRAAKARRSG